MRNITAAVIIIMLLATFSASATTRYVPSQYSTIQAAIDACANGDTVIVSPGTYYENINFNGKNITLTSLDPNDSNIAASTIIDGNAAGSVITFTGTEDESCVLSGFTITNGYIDGNAMGSGICGNNTGACVRKCNIIANSTSSSAGTRGGGIANLHGYIDSCLIQHNYTMRGGGGLYNCDGPITNCSILSNHTPLYSGGGLDNCDGPISNCVIAYNEGDIDAGGLSYCNGPITNCKIIGNWTRHADGGGLGYCNGPITGCVIASNRSFGSGGGLLGCSGPITNCTVANNRAEGYNWGNGGGLAGCTGSITNCIVCGNTALKDGDQLYRCSDPNYSCIQDWTGGGVENINTDPCFVNPDVNDFHLLPDSPCINAGDPNYAAEPNETDLDGNPRVTGGRIDMGAYEYWPPLEAEMKFIPQVINIGSKSKWVKAYILLPGGLSVGDIDVNSPAVAGPMGTESQNMKVFENDQGRCVVECDFDRSAFCEALTSSGSLEVTVNGLLRNGREFTGSDTIKIIAHRKTENILRLRGCTPLYRLD